MWKSGKILLYHEHLDLQPEAIAAHQQVVRLLPDNARAHRLLGMAQLDYDCCRLPIIVSNVHWPWPWTIRKINGKISSSAPCRRFPSSLAALRVPFPVTRATTQSMISHNLAAGRTTGRPTLLLHAEQGYGDTLQMIRYLPRVERVERLIL